MSERGRGRGGYGGRGQPPPSHSQGRGTGGRGHYNQPYGPRGPAPSVASSSTMPHRPIQPMTAVGRGQGRGGAGNDVAYGYRPPVQWVASSSSASVRPTPPATEFQNLSLGSSTSISVKTAASDPVQRQPLSTQQSTAAPTSQTVSLVPSSSKLHKAPARPGFGTLGKKLLVKANHFLVDLGSNDPYQYDVTISPEVASKTKCRHIMKCLTEEYQESNLGNRRLAYDGKKSAFVAGQLPFESKEFVINAPENDGRTREFKVTVKFAAKKDINHLREFLSGGTFDNNQETIQALDVVLRESASQGREIIGKSIYCAAFGNGSLGGGIDYWRGFYQSLRPTQMGLSINIDMSATAFFDNILVSDFVMEFLNKDVTRPLSEQDRIKVKKALRGVKVEVTRGDFKRAYKVRGITTETTNQLTFPIDGTTLTVVQYYRQKYNQTLRFPFLPAIQAGTDAKPTYLPMEICRIAGCQRYSKKLSDRQVTSMLKATCKRPNDREKEIENVIERNTYNQDKLVKDFGMQVNEQLTAIEARVLPPPTLKYHNSGRQAEVNPSVGQWNMMNSKMFNGGAVNFWAIINFSRQGEDAVKRFCSGIKLMCRDKGMTFRDGPLIPLISAAPQNMERALCDLHSRCSQVSPGNLLQLLIVILPETSGSYGKIKRVCETELGIVSQCCQPKHVVRPNQQYFVNLSMKINVKVGGRNVIWSHPQAEIAEHPTIIFGADVSHPQPGEDSGPSIASVVASMDWPDVSKYRALVSSQPHRQEIIEDLYTTYADAKGGIISRGMIRELLIAFRNATGRKPHRIVFYRDGVSEGQFNGVLLHEMDKIRRACASLEEGYMPRVTFIVVQKRHHTRLFPMNHGDRASTDRSGNILPGTVVDTNICHPTEFDFYLCSHAGIQGTSRPTHYHVLYDENNFTADGLQTLTNNLCYTYARCTRSVSIVPAVYYAHLSAFRARYYTEGYVTESESGVGTTRERAVQVRALPVVHDNVKEFMFYC